MKILTAFMALRKKDPWESEASKPTEYHCVEARRGREFIIRMTTDTDVYKALQQFVKDKKIKFGRIHPPSWVDSTLPRFTCGPLIIRTAPIDTTR